MSLLRTLPRSAGEGWREPRGGGRCGSACLLDQSAPRAAFTDGPARSNRVGAEELVTQGGGGSMTRGGGRESPRWQGGGAELRYAAVPLGPRSPPAGGRGGGGGIGRRGRGGGSPAGSGL